MSSFFNRILLMCLLITGSLVDSVAAEKKTYGVTIIVIDKSSRTPITMATCVLNTQGPLP
jgi:hypothetical protein